MTPDMEKETFLNNFEREYKTTRRVLEAFPDSKLDYKPNPKSKTARELAAIFPEEAGTIAKMIPKLAIDPSMSTLVKRDFIKDIVAALDKAHKEAVEVIKNTPMEHLVKIMDFFGMKIRLIDGLWFFMMDAIHHRGQFSVYLRLVDAKVPPIYGPTADYPTGQM